MVEGEREGERERGKREREREREGRRERERERERERTMNEIRLYTKASVCTVGVNIVGELLMGSKVYTLDPSVAEDVFVITSS